MEQGALPGVRLVAVAVAEQVYGKGAVPLADHRQILPPMVAAHREGRNLLAHVSSSWVMREPLNV